MVPHSLKTFPRISSSMLKLRLPKNTRVDTSVDSSSAGLELAVPPAFWLRKALPLLPDAAGASLRSSRSFAEPTLRGRFICKKGYSS
jgi:hypothetical protein